MHSHMRAIRDKNAECQHSENRKPERQNGPSLYHAPDLQICATRPKSLRKSTSSNNKPEHERHRGHNNLANRCAAKWTNKCVHHVRKSVKLTSQRNTPPCSQQRGQETVPHIGLANWYTKRINNSCMSTSKRKPEQIQHRVHNSVSIRRVAQRVRKWVQLLITQQTRTNTISQCHQPFSRTLCP